MSQMDDLSCKHCGSVVFGPLWHPDLKTCLECNRPFKEPLEKLPILLRLGFILGIVVSIVWACSH